MMNAFVIILAIFCVAQIATIPLLRPVRSQMVNLAEQMLADDSLSDEAHAEINGLLDSALSYRVGAMLPVSQIYFIFSSVLRVPPPEEDEVTSHPLFGPLMWRYILSNAGNNLPAGILTALLMPLVFAAAISSREDDVVRDFEDSVFHLGDRIGRAEVA